MFLKIFCLALPLFIACDAVWIGLIAHDFYQSSIGHLLRPDVNWIAAILFYCIYLAGLTVFVIQPAIEQRLWKYALIMGAFFGLVAYATYDLTNLAMTKNWPILITIVDLAWGTVVTAFVSIVTYYVLRKRA